eukprot:jgi/Chlat1/2392/Chrsp17S02821
MARGEPLTDEDRWPWLHTLADAVKQQELGAVASCSALKRSYRRFLSETIGPSLRFVHLQGSEELIQQRIASRHGHFMPASLLHSQFAALEGVTEEENAVSVDINSSPDETAEAALKALGLESRCQ